jgi:hypothetical protein
MTLSIMTFRIMTFSIIKRDTQHNEIQHNDRVLLCCVILLNVTDKPFMLSVVC